MNLSAHRQWRALPLAVVGAVILALAGCKLGPDYRRPDTSAPSTYRFDGPSTAASLADEGWWQVYQDPELKSRS